MQNCYNTGNRIPREKQYNQDEQLTNKHIQTLQFVQEVVEENKKLKKRVEELEMQQLKCPELHALAEHSQDRIKTIQEQYLKRTDEINAMMAEKHRGEMMKVVQEKLDVEKKHNEDVGQLKSDVSQLEGTNQELMSRVGLLVDAQEVLNCEINDFTEQIASLETEIALLQGQNEELSSDKTRQFSQIQNLHELRSLNDDLSNDLKAMSHRNVELTHKVSQLQAELQDSGTTQEQAALIDSFKNKLNRLHKEKSVSTEKEMFYLQTIAELKLEIEQLKDSLESAESSREQILDEYHHVHTELQHLKRYYASSMKQGNFKDFVKLKREVATLKDANYDLKHSAKAVGSGDSDTSLPMLKYEPHVPAVAKPDKDRKKKTGLKSS